MKTEEFTTLPLQIEIPTEIRDFNLGLMFRESLDTNSGMLFIFDEVAQQSFHMRETKIPLDIAFIREDGIIESIKQLEPNDETAVESDGDILCALEVNRGWFAENNVEVGDEIDIEEGKKDACYHKVKSRYSVWPSAYASGALVKCRKVGAANWGNSTKKEEYMSLPEMTDIQINALKKAGFEVEVIDEKCWKGYEKKGMKTMFGKRYPNCVKKEETEVAEGKYSSGSVTYVKGTAPVRATYGGKTETFPKETYKKKGMVKTAEEAEVRYCPKCEKNETREECVYGGKYWDENSMPAKDVKEATIELTDSYGDTFATVETKTEAKVEESKKEVELDTYDTESMTEAVRIPAKTGNIVMVNLGWKGKYYSIKMFFPQVSKPSRKDVQDQIEKIYPGGKLYTFVVSNYEPGEPMLHAEGAAWTKKEGKNKSGGLNEKGRKSYERENPGSDLKAPSKKVGNPRRASFCARMKGMKKKLTSKKTANDPDSRINKSLRAWNC